MKNSNGMKMLIIKKMKFLMRISLILAVPQLQVQVIYQVEIIKSHVNTMPWVLQLTT